MLRQLLISSVLSSLLFLPSAVLGARWSQPFVGRSCVSSALQNKGNAASVMASLRGGEIEKVTSLSHVKEVLAKAEENKQLVVIKFTSKDCEPCRMIAPLYSELSESEEFSSVVFLAVSVDETPDVATFYQVNGWPTFLFWKNGDVQTEIVGGKLAQATLYDWVKLLKPTEE